MMFNERIKQLHKDCQISQQKLTVALDINTVSYCKIEKGNFRAGKKYIYIIAKFLQGDKEKLLTLWLANQITVVIAEKKEFSNKVLNIAKKNIDQN